MDQTPVTQILLGASMALLAVGLWLVTRRAILAVVAVAPLALFVPWGLRITWRDPAAVFPLAAAVVWLYWLLDEKGAFGEGRRPFLHWAIVTVAACTLVTLSPQILFLFAVMVGYCIASGKSGNKARIAALLVIPLAYRVGQLLPGAVLENQAASATFWLDATVAGGWNASAWMQSPTGLALRTSQSELNSYFYAPLLPLLLACASRYRSRWWFGPTFTWAACIVIGTAVFGRTLVFHHSVAFQMALVAPFAAVGIEDIKTALHGGGAADTLHGGADIFTRPQSGGPVSEKMAGANA